MAVVSIWHRSGNQAGLIDYVTKEEKVSGINGLLQYTTNEEKTNHNLYVSGINCEPETAAKEFAEVKLRWGKEGGYVAWHGVQSFKPGETDPDTAHKIGVEFAHKMWGNHFQVVVTTHLDQKHLHNHFAINSVSFVDGKKLDRNKDYYRAMQDLNDEICSEYGLDVLKSKRKTLSLRDKIKDDIDKLLVSCRSLYDLKTALQKLGYQFQNANRKHPAIRAPNGKRFIRLRSLGDAYSEENLKRRINGEEIEAFAANRYKSKQFIRAFEYYKSKRIPTALQKRYLRVMLLVSAKGEYPRQKLPQKVRAAMQSLNRMGERIYWLKHRNLSKLSEVLSYQKQIKMTHEHLINQRKILYRQLRKVPDDELSAVKEKIDAISEDIRQSYREIRMCDGILAEYPYLKNEHLVHDKITGHTPKQEPLSIEKRSEPHYEYRPSYERSR